MAAIWKIKVGSDSIETLEEAGVEVAGINTLTQSTSSLRLRVIGDFDEVTDRFTYGTAVIFYRGTTKVFQGKVRVNPRDADDQSERQMIEVYDAWDEMERTTYQESWKKGGASTVMIPKAILGLDQSGNSIDTGEQIQLAIDYAASVGIDVQSGTFPSGITFWPSQLENVTISEVIRTSMRYHPDWTLVTDYSTTPPTVSVISQAAADEVSFSVAGNGDVQSFSVRAVSERVPESVRIVYESLADFDGVTATDFFVDKFPADGPNAGPNVLNTTIELAGVRTTSKTQPIEIRTLPTDQDTLRSWLKLKFPKLADVPDARWQVTVPLITLVADGEQPPALNEATPRQEISDATEVPRELVRGSVQDWMRVKVGKVNVAFGIRFTPGYVPTEKEKKLIPDTSPNIIVTATNATTKNYRGLASFAAGEAAPNGLAEQFYNSLASTQYAGSVKLAEDEISQFGLLGKALNLTGGRSEWANMDALITSVSYDIENGTTNISFGPPRYLTPGDWMELQRALRNRTATWQANRDSEEPVDDGSTIVGDYDTPSTENLPTFNAPCAFRLIINGNAGSGFSWEVSSLGSSITDGANGPAIDLSSAGFDNANAISDDKWIVLQADVSAGTPASWVLAAVAAADTAEVGFDTATPPAQNKIRLRIGKVSFSSGEAAAIQAVKDSQILTDGWVNGAFCKVLAAHSFNEAT